MKILLSRKTIIIVVFLAIALLSFYLLKDKDQIEDEIVDEFVEENNDPVYSVIGKSVEGREIGSYKFGDGETNIAFVGGIHGGYEWNSTLLAYGFIDYFTENPESIPENISVNIIPSANPDGLFKVTGQNGRFGLADVSTSESILVGGRLNTNGVDLNRNFDCKWQPESTWRGNPVSAGDHAFSEPEAKAIKDFVDSENPVAVVFWHSQANAVYASECKEGPLEETIKIMNQYSSASGYKAIEVFDSYEITGDAEGWLASIGIPAITVELKNHEEIDWGQNLSGVKALLNYFES